MLSVQIWLGLTALSRSREGAGFMLVGRLRRFFRDPLRIELKADLWAMRRYDPPLYTGLILGSQLDDGLRSVWTTRVIQSHVRCRAAEFKLGFMGGLLLSLVSILLMAGVIIWYGRYYPLPSGYFSERVDHFIVFLIVLYVGVYIAVDIDAVTLDIIDAPEKRRGFMTRLVIQLLLRLGIPQARWSFVGMSALMLYSTVSTGLSQYFQNRVPGLSLAFISIGFFGLARVLTRFLLPLAIVNAVHRSKKDNPELWVLRLLLTAVNLLDSNCKYFWMPDMWLASMPVIKEASEIIEKILGPRFAGSFRSCRARDI